MNKTLVAALCMGAALSAGDVSARDTLVRQGEYLARAGDCTACHTKAGGEPFAGGLPLQTPIGIIYSTNITPDARTGIGDYSFEAFDNAVRRGIRKDGSTLYPAMPYPSYARISDGDMRALYAYFMGAVPAVSQSNRASDIPWPLSIRAPLAVWRWWFAPSPDTPASPTLQDPQVNRGAYLVEGLGHCGTCHSPRALTLQEKALHDDDGKLFLSGGAPLEGWVAKDLRGSEVTGLGQWSEQDIVQFLKTGRNDRTAAFGGMSDVVVHSMQYLSDSDLTSIAKYLKTLSAQKTQDVSVPARDVDTAQKLHDLQINSLGGRIYADNCMACHRSDGKGYAQTFPGLAGNTVLNDDKADSAIRIILGGFTVPATTSASTAYTMPAFGWRLSDSEVAAVTSFIRQAWNNSGSVINENDVAKVRKSMDINQQRPHGMTVHDGAVSGHFSSNAKP